MRLTSWKTLFLLCTIVYYVKAQIDQTWTPMAKGKDVTEAVVRKIKKSEIFGDDSDFTRRVAWVESKFGEDPKTFRADYFGGIWQVDQDIYVQTKDTTRYPRLNVFYASTLDYFGINWNNTSWQMLQIPLHSALALRFYFFGVLNLTPPIPGTLADQANSWKNNFNRNTSTTRQDFIDQVKDLENEPICKGRMDICIVLDGSQSVTLPNFRLARQFVASLVDTFEIGPENVKSGLVEYSTGVSTIIPVENNFNKETLNRLILETPYSNGRTNTPAGIRRAVDLLLAVNYRSGVPKVMTVLTDGQSNMGNLPAAIQYALQHEIVSFAVGIGNGAVRAELLAIAFGDPSHVFEMTSFDALAEFFYRLNSATCTTPQKPELNETVKDSLVKGESRYYLYEIPEEGVTLKVELTSGLTQAYYSYKEEVPSSAIHNGTTEGGNLIFIAGSTSESPSGKKVGRDVYIAIEGIEDKNEYSLILLAGNQVSSSNQIIVGFTLISFFVIFNLIPILDS